MDRRSRLAFTLLEILLVIAAIGILAAIIIIAINPQRQLAQVRNAQRTNDINAIQDAMDQYGIDGGELPTEVPFAEYQSICQEGETVDCFDLSALVPQYITAVPIDPNGESYEIGIHPETNQISLRSPTTELGQLVAINEFVPYAKGIADESFNIGTGFNNWVYSMSLQPDGKILAGGEFTEYQGSSAPRIARLNPDGSRDSSFVTDSGFNSAISIYELQPDGKILVGGSFTTYKGVSANRIIRLNPDGSRDDSFVIDSGFDNSVSAFAVQSDGKIIIGGSFTTYKGSPVNSIVRVNSDGTLDSSFNILQGFNDRLRSIVLQSDGTILVGGDFSTYQGASAGRIIRLNPDGSRDTTFDMGTGFNNEVHSIIVQSDGKLVVGGLFVTYRGVGANRIARINSDGSRDTSFDVGVGFNTRVRHLALQSDDKIIVGGDFTSYQGTSANRIIRLNSDGSRDETFEILNAFNERTRRVIVQPDAKIIAVGDFVTYQGTPFNQIIRIR